MDGIGEKNTWRFVEAHKFIARKMSQTETKISDNTHTKNRRLKIEAVTKKKCLFQYVSV